MLFETFTGHYWDKQLMRWVGLAMPRFGVDDGVDARGGLIIFGAVYWSKRRRVYWRLTSLLFSILLRTSEISEESDTKQREPIRFEQKWWTMKTEGRWTTGQQIRSDDYLSSGPNTSRSCTVIIHEWCCSNLVVYCRNNIKPNLQCICFTGFQECGLSNNAGIFAWKSVCCTMPSILWHHIHISDPLQCVGHRHV